MANGASPYDQWPAQNLDPNWEAPKPMTGPAGTPGGPPQTVPQAVASSMPSWSDVGNALAPRAEYVGKRFLRGVSSPEHDEAVAQGMPGVAPLAYPDPGQRPDLATGITGAFAEDFGRNPLLTMMFPVRSLINAGIGESMVGFPQWERDVATGVTGLMGGVRGVSAIGEAKNILNRVLRHPIQASIPAAIGHMMYGTPGAAIGGTLGAVGPSVSRVGSSLLRNPQMPLAGALLGTYQGSPQGQPPMNQLSQPAQ